VLETIVGCSGPDVVRDPKLFDMSKALEVSPTRAEKKYEHENDGESGRQGAYVSTTLQT